MADFSTLLTGGGAALSKLGKVASIPSELGLADLGQAATTAGNAVNPLNVVAKAATIPASKIESMMQEAKTSAIQKAPLAETLQDARDAGYVVPPSTVEPSLKNTLTEGLSGKIATAQEASLRNSQVTDYLARKAIGLPETAPLTQETVGNVMSAAHAKGYEPLRDIGTIATDGKYIEDLKNIEKPFVNAEKSFPTGSQLATDTTIKPLMVNRFDSSNALDKISNLRKEASAAYASGDSVLGAAKKSAATALEDVIQRNLEYKANAVNAYQTIADTIGKRMSGADFDSLSQAKTIMNNLKSGKITQEMGIEQLNNISAKSKTARTALNDAANGIAQANNNAAKAVEMLKNYKESRVLMAKAHNVSDAIREGGGTVDPKYFARQLQKGAPLTGELATIGKFANNFGKASQRADLIGGAGVSKLDAALGAVVGGGGMAMAGPVGLAAAVAPAVASRLSRNYLLSEMKQNALAKNAYQPGTTLKIADKVVRSSNALADFMRNRNINPSAAGLAAYQMNQPKK
jgi:hypothetical protein